jgi:3-dehydroquinate dehydratase
MNNQNPNQQGQQQKQIQIKATDEVMRGTYANAMQVRHNKEEFLLDFLNIFPPQGSLNARVITSPGHFKRIVLALQDNLKKYENTFGEIEVANAPKNEVGFGERKE